MLVCLWRGVFFIVFEMKEYKIIINYEDIVINDNL